MPVDYNNRKFKSVSSSENAEVGVETVFEYQQEGNTLSCNYSGGKIITGHLLGLVDENGSIEMVYHQLNTNHQLMTGKCSSKPTILPNGKIRLYETWQWTSGDFSKGESILEEI